MTNLHKKILCTHAVYKYSKQCSQNYCWLLWLHKLLNNTEMHNFRLLERNEARFEHRLDHQWSMHENAFCLHPSYITVAFIKQILSPISTSLLSCSLSTPLLDLFLACIIFSLCLILHFLTIDCSVCLVKDTSSSAWHFIIVHDDGLSQTDGEATAPLPAIKVWVQKNLHWFAPDLKGESANIEISISGGLVTEHWLER